MLTRTILLKMADSATLRALVEKRGWWLAHRFVAGRTLEEALAAVGALHARGIAATLSRLGEHVTGMDRARAEAAAYHDALAALSDTGWDCHLSIKPSQMGLQIDAALAEQEIAALLSAAAGRFVRLDMEDSSMTDATLALVRALHARSPNVGTVIQAYLRRSRDDVNALNAQGIAVRLCKGAYNEPPSVAFPSKAEVDENFYILMKMLLHGGTTPAFATHDERLIRAAISIAREELPRVERIAPRPNADTRRWEFQMLYGIRRDLQASLVAEGFGMRVYVPYGTEWYPYFMRRLAERPANIAFFLRSLRQG
jgi:proline dehydrogenase